MVPSRGSLHPLDIFIILSTFAPAYHCCQIWAQAEYIAIAASGAGYFPAVALNTESHLAILLISANLVESRADADWDEKERNAIVARIARMTMTTMSSTSVKPEIFVFCHPSPNLGGEINVCFFIFIYIKLRLKKPEGRNLPAGRQVPFGLKLI